MGPGDRIKVKWLNWWALSLDYNQWPYKHTVGISLLKLRLELGFGLPYTDPDYGK